tara:strand:+ start:110 stop:616 length:507 start_codon:yes stop_codon:yes gene_type:complete
MVARKTMGGQSIDMEALIAANEDARAVGNMMTNAKGDQLDEKGNIVKTAQQIAGESHVNPIVQTNQSIKDLGFTPEPGATPMADNVQPQPKAVPKAEPKPAPKPAPKKKVVAQTAPTPQPAPKVEPKEVPEDDWTEQEVELEITDTKEEWVEDPDTGDFVPKSSLKKK